MMVTPSNAKAKAAHSVSIADSHDLKVMIFMSDPLQAGARCSLGLNAARQVRQAKSSRLGPHKGCLSSCLVAD
jgi:hypothetical protein